MLRLNATFGALWLLFSSITGRSQQFTETPIDLGTNVFSPALASTVVADYDGDGSLDLLVIYLLQDGSCYDWVLAPALNDGTGVFHMGLPIRTNIGNCNRDSFLVEDFDRDGRYDVYEIGGGLIHFNLGAGAFTQGIPAIPLSNAVAGDVNGDGTIDLVGQTTVITGPPSGLDSGTRVYLNSNGTFRSSGPVLDIGGYWLLNLNDFDGDGKKDILTGIHSDPADPTRLFTRLLRNPGNGMFNLPSSDIGPVGGNPFVVWVEDEDNDGDIDVVTYGGVTPENPASRTRITNDGAGNFNAQPVDPRYIKGGADFDNDGDRDPFVLVGNPAGDFQLHRNDGPAGLVPLPLFLPDTVAIGDFDNDGDLDIVAVVPRVGPSGYVQSFLRLFRNNSQTPNRLPSAPGGLATTIRTDDRVTLSWQRSTDDHTPVQLLTYNVRVGTRPGGVDILSPGGRIARPGNAGSVVFRDLRHLAPGQYYWSVQSVDGLYGLSDWAPEQSFTVAKPVILPVDDVFVQPGVKSRPINITVLGDLTPVDQLILTAKAQDTALIPDSGLVLLGSGALRQLTITPTNHIGTTVVSITATDKAGFTGTVEFWVNVTPFGILSLDEPIAGVAGNDFAWVDLDGDGRLDLIGVGANQGVPANIYSVYLNAGNGRMKAEPIDLPLWFGGSILPGDLDGDNLPDFLLSGVDYSSWLRPPENRVWRNDQGLHFSAVTPQLTNFATVLAVTDRDRNGLADVATWGRGQVFGVPLDAVGDPAQGFQILSPGTVLSFLAGVVWADLDGNGDLDLVISGQESGATFLRVFRRDDAGHFIKVDTGLPQEMMAIVGAADVDNDGLVDLYVGALTPDPAHPSDGIPPPRIWRNLGNMQFAPTSSTFPPEVNGVPAWGDFDNDGNLDVFLLSKLLRNDGSGNFSVVDANLPTVSATSAAWGDVDGDGDLDLFVTGVAGSVQGWTQAGRFLALNTSTRTNTPPSVPSGLSARFIGEETLLFWDPAVDAENSKSLTYNVRLGTTPSGSQIVSALADPATGRRRISGFGNCGPTTRRRIGKLPNGLYYWTVQSVDAGFASSAFAPEQILKVRRPYFAGFTNLVVDPNLFAGPFLFTVGDAETAASAIRVTVKSSDASLVPASNLALTGSAEIRGFSFTPAPHASGTLTLTFTAEDTDGEIEVTRINVTIKGEFSPVATSFPDIASPAAVWGDVDNDGDLDLLLGGDGATAIWRNDNGSIGTNVTAHLADTSLGDAALIDVNNDGFLDAFVTGGSGASYLYLGDGSGSFKEVLPSPLAQLTRSAVAWGDADNDGDIDALLMGTPSLNFIDNPQMYTFINWGGTAFATSPWFSPALRDGAAVWVDIDNDGDNDLIITGSTTFNPSGSQTLIYRNDNGILTPIPHNLPAVSFNALAVADFDLDGNPDLLISGNGPTGALTKLFRNDGNGNFTEVPTSLPQLSSPAIAWGDYDGDGYPDLLLTGATNVALNVNVVQTTTEIWRNDGGTFRRTGDSFQGVYQGAAAWGDFDGDGDLDAIVAGTTQLLGPGLTRLYRNDLNHVAEVPPAPIYLLAETIGNDEILSWSMPPGAPKGLSYNIRVGTAPGLGDVMSANADPVTGHRRVAANGNAGWSGRWRLRNLPLRTYYWSVQAINSAFSGSEFAIEDSFVVGNAPPTISGIPDQITTMNQTNLQVAFTVGDSDSDLSTLNISVRSSNTNLVPSANIQVSGTGTDRRMTLAPAVNQTGISTITITVKDNGGATTSDTFRVIVNALSLTASIFPNVVASAIEPADYDRDGHIDLFLAGREPIAPGSSRGYAAVLRGDGQGNFAVASTLPPTLSDAFGAWGDYDGDGDLDLFHTGALYRNDGASFTKVWSDLQDIANGAVAWGDFDNDGRLDFAICGYPIFTRIYHNDGNDHFTDVQAPLVGVWLGAVSWCDTDGDGDLDLLVTGAAAEIVDASPVARLYRNDGGRFVEVRQFFGVVNGKISWGDVNGDGRPDLLYSGTHGQDTIARLYINLGGNQFIEATLPSGGFVLPGSTLVDWDNDGDLDFVRYTSSSFAVHRNDGTGRFGDSPAEFVNAPAAAFRTIDFDNDRDPDAVVAGTTVAGVPAIRLYENPRILPPPIDPVGLTAVVDGDTVLLSWPLNPNAPIVGPKTYNLRVGTTPGGLDVLSPMSDPATGRRRVPQSGNAGAINSHRLRGLSPGTYFWSVQSVDGALNGSSFANVASFVVATSPPPPRFSSIRLIGGGQVRVEILGQPGWFVLIDRSTDLRNWTSVGAYQLDESGALTWSGFGNDVVDFFRFRQTP